MSDEPPENVHLLKMITGGVPPSQAGTPVAVLEHALERARRGEFRLVALALQDAEHPEVVHTLWSGATPVELAGVVGAFYHCVMHTIFRVGKK